MKTLRVLHAMPRSGSTLLSAMLTSLPDVVLLSEVHPTLPLVGHPCDQARDWHGLLTPCEAEAWKEKYCYGEILARLNDLALFRGKTLVVREWSYPDHKLPEEETPLLPTWWSSTARHCNFYFDELQRMSLVREPVDQWLSFQKFNERCHDDEKSPTDLRSVMKSYRHFAEMAATTALVRFEDLTVAPKLFLQRVCSLLKVPYTDVGDAWKTCTKVTGDPATMISHPTVEVLPRKPVDPKTLARLRSCEDYLATCRLLHYAACRLLHDPTR